MTEPTAVPFEPGQIVVLGAGPEHARRWYRTSVYSVDARVVWVDGAPEGQPLVDVQPGENRDLPHLARHGRPVPGGGDASPSPGWRPIRWWA